MVNIAIKLTVAQMSKTFAGMNADEQACFFAQTWEHLKESCGGVASRAEQCGFMQEAVAYMPNAQAFLTELREPEDIWKNIKDDLRNKGMGVPVNCRCKIDLREPNHETAMAKMQKLIAENKAAITKAVNPYDFVRQYQQEPLASSFDAEALRRFAQGQSYRGWDLATQNESADRAHRRDAKHLTKPVTMDFALAKQREVAAIVLGSGYVELRDEYCGRHYFAKSTSTEEPVWKFYKNSGGCPDKAVIGEIKSCGKIGGIVEMPDKDHLMSVKIVPRNSISYVEESSIGVAPSATPWKRLWPVAKQTNGNSDCPDCNGTGKIEMFNSFVECEKCQG